MANARNLSQEIISYIDRYAGDTQCLPIIYLAAETDRYFEVGRNTTRDMSYVVSRTMSVIRTAPNLEDPFFMMRKIREIVDAALQTLNQRHARMASSQIYIEPNTFARFMEIFAQHAQTHDMTVRRLQNEADAFLICASVSDSKEGVLQQALENRSFKIRKRRSE